MAGWAQRLSVRLVGSHVALVVLMALLIGLLVVGTTQDAVERSAAVGLQEVARRAAEEVRHIVNEPIAGLQAAAVAMNVEREDWQRQSLLSQLGLAVEALEQVSLVDTQGYVEATSVLDLNAALRAGQQLPEGYIGDPDSMWASIRAAGIHVSRVDLTAGRPSLTVALPVREGKRLVGALVARLNLYTMWQKIDRIGAGATGRGVLLEGSGRIIAHPERQVVFRQERHAQAAQIQSRGEGWTGWSDQGGVAWVAAFAPVQGLDWQVVVEQHAAEAFELVAPVRRQIEWIVACCVVGATALGLVLLRSITGPLNGLTKAVRRYQAGDSSPIEVPARQDEIGELAAALQGLSTAVSEQRLVELALMQQEKLAVLGEMAAGVAHEVKNPLAIMKSAADLLRRLSPAEEEERLKTLQVLDGAIERCNGQLLRLLDFARPAREVQEWIDVNQILRPILELLGQRARDGGIEPVADYGRVAYVLANRDTLKDVFLNLMTNAFDAMPDGGQLRLSTRTEEGKTVVEVADTGTGMTPEIAARIFDPFFTTKPPGAGTGLGLAVGYRQIREAGGEIQVTSVEGHGSVFRVVLPAAPSKEDGA